MLHKLLPMVCEQKNNHTGHWHGIFAGSNTRAFISCSASAILCRQCLFHQFLQRFQQLIHNFVIPGTDTIRHTGADMVCQQLTVERVHRRRYRRRLHQNIRTIHFVFHHPRMPRICPSIRFSLWTRLLYSSSLRCFVLCAQQQHGSFFSFSCIMLPSHHMARYPGAGYIHYIPRRGTLSSR